MLKQKYAPHFTVVNVRTIARALGSNIFILLKNVQKQIKL